MNNWRTNLSWNEVIQRGLEYYEGNKPPPRLYPYLCWVNDPMYSGCIVVFHYTMKQARYLAYKKWQELLDCTGWEILQDMRMHRKDDKWMVLKDKNSAIPHVIESYDGHYDTWDDYVDQLSSMDALSKLHKSIYS